MWLAIVCSAFAATNLHLGVVRNPVGPHGGHLNPRGHRWLAALLLPGVTELLELERPPPGGAPDQLQAR